MPELTPQDIHEAYNQTIRDNPKSQILLTEWKDVKPYALKMYKRMAELLNEKIAQKEVK